MSMLQTQNFDQTHNLNIFNEDNFENDDLIAFQHDSKTINLYYSQLTKYSKYIRDSYLFKDVLNCFSQEIQKFQKESQILPDSIDLFFQLLQQNYNINKDFNFTYIQCIDLLKISKFLEVRKLSFKINEYIKDQNINVDFIIQMIQYEIQTKKEAYDHTINISEEIEQLLTQKINEFLTNEKFKELPIQIIYRVVSKSSASSINSNKLFDIIMKSLSKFCVLFPFLNLQNLSEDRLDDLCEIYSSSDEKTHQYFNYLKCNLNLIREINKRKKNLEKTNDEQMNKMDELESKVSSLQEQFSNSEKLNDHLQSQLKESNDLINEQQNKTKELETKVASLQKQSVESDNINNQLKSQLNDSKELISEQQSKMKDLESQVNQLQMKLTSSEKEMSDVRKQLDEIFLIKGQVSAKVENGLLISAEINLILNNSSLNTSRSKFIISKSGEKSLGNEAYEKGEPITSLHFKTASYLCKSGTYFVRCIVFNSNGESNEFVSSPITTSGSSATFGYEGKPAKISLCKGKYKLEVWGAKGGDSTGKGQDGSYPRNNQSLVKGGLGGYSSGNLNLDENETVYVYVGGAGRLSELAEGTSTEGGFPDGGGTKTERAVSSCTTVPGTGGGSTSIRIGSETDYARVIVAGGGGGASGCCHHVDPGGFGGGLAGGNCTYTSSLQSQGAGTQTGSTSGLGCGSDRHGYPGSFGLGATNNFKKGCDSGGGGGGGWYGGGSGGYGNGAHCSSGGGGSGWVFTESSFKNWQKGDPSNASKFVLNGSYYLTDEVCIGGNEDFPRPDGNGIEHGHDGNGIAKITPL